MGIAPDKSDKFLDDGITPHIKANFPYDITVDHIVDLGYGGLNDFENLCLIPGYLNELKGNFVQAQELLAFDRVLSFRPRPDAAGNAVYVPVLQGGFQLLTNDSNTLRIRAETLFNADLKRKNEPSRPNIFDIAPSGP